MVEVRDDIRQLEIFMANSIRVTPSKAHIIGMALEGTMRNASAEVEANKSGIYQSLIKVGYTNKQLQELDFFRDYNPK